MEELRRRQQMQQQADAGSNGTVPPAMIPMGPVAPHRTRWVDIPEYPGFKMRVWVNYTQAKFNDIFASDDDTSSAASREIFIEHNGWRQEDGTPFPPMSEPLKFWDACSNELAALLIGVLRDEAAKLPNSLLRPRGTSASTSSPAGTAAPPQA
jgi:hypothetical protein